MGLRHGPPLLMTCKSVEHYEKLNRIEEGTYGVVYRARDRETGEIVALKRLKLDKETQGFPVTSLREIHTLMAARHPHIVHLREMVTSAPSSSSAGPMPSIYLVMDFVEHDLRGLLEAMPTPFLPSEVKTLMGQLLSAAALMHSQWILHRDLKPSNLLMNNTGHVVVADFGLARTYGEPQDPSSALTTPVVTLWYRSPELLLGSKTYGPPVDMWSIGCIFAELLSNTALFPGKGEMDQLSRIFQVLGLPTDEGWPGWRDLPHAQGVTFRAPSGQSKPLRSMFPHLTHHGLELLGQLLAYDPNQRISAQEALKHPYFSEAPLPKHPSLFPSWPSKASQEGQQRRGEYE
ncbi:kinase-like domain-containing protein [Piptocephalis cylindrospora]|uniref:cyclin-dependent kinase n=1 Tax=Piptocephalis cylindrospora TaxID=1907219 RepID=A0A4P9Y6Y4_9FUNG|nr:kinase-like domain-containing protein [Piptocephalis cylindrospora]|eukprot:RKP14795.1 kinase-like domain-containing protein [Piptocephalis cylindrospora]